VPQLEQIRNADIIGINVILIGRGWRNFELSDDRLDG
jgi:hypothetical protein